MKNALVFWVRSLTFTAVAAAIVLLVRLMQASGVRGLLSWVPSFRSYVAVVAAMGAIPFLLAVAHEFVRGRSAVRAAPALGWITLAVSSLVTIVCLGGAIFLAYAPLSVDLPVPEVNILNPVKGIPVHEISKDQPYLRLAISSDPHWGAPKSNAQERTSILQTIDVGGYDAFFLLGDLAEQGFPEQGLREAATDLGRFLHHVPIRPMLGNHDALIGAAGRWSRYFFPASHSSDSGSPYYYRVDAGRTHILVLNLLWGEEEFDTAQRNWLTENLESIPREDAVIVLSHCYFYASGYKDPESGSLWYDHPGTIREISPILEKYGVDLVVSGHNHYMELLEHNGVTYAIIGAMGGVPDPEPSYHSPASTWMKTATHGFLDVESYADHLELVFRDSSGGELHRISVSTDR
jgi:hypothetical protein